MSGLYALATVSPGVFPAGAKWLLVHDRFALFGLAFLKENEELKRNKIPFVIKYV